VRLVDGPHRCGGRVEVYHNGEWGTVCDDDWGIADAEVVCREIGCGPAVSAPGSARFGQGSGRIWLDDVACTAAAASIFDCKASSWGSHNCGHGEDAGIVCSGKEIGCGSAVSAPGSARFGQGPGRIWLDDVACTAAAASIFDCKASLWGSHNCGHGEDAGVVCSGKFYIHYDWCVVYYSYDYKQCVYCPSMHHGAYIEYLFATKKAAPERTRVKRAPDSVHLTPCNDKTCNENVSFLLHYCFKKSQCAFLPFWSFSPNSSFIGTEKPLTDGSELAGTESTTDFEKQKQKQEQPRYRFMLSNTLSPLKLTKVFSYCTFTNKESFALHSSDIKLSSISWGLYLKKINNRCEEKVLNSNIHYFDKLKYFKCECKLFWVCLYYFCKGGEVKQHIDSIIDPTGEVRLVNGTHLCAGRVEIHHNGEWGTVCDDGWGLEEAEVVCREIGCGSAVSAPRSARFGQGSGRIWLDNVACTAATASIFKCKASSWGSHNCGHGQDAGVVCSAAKSILKQSSIFFGKKNPTGGANTVCTDTTMTLSVPKSSFNRLHNIHFHLNDPSCSVTSNGTHIIASVSLNSCGTQMKETRDYIIFKNEITSFNHPHFVITRKHDVQIPFSCSFPKRTNVAASFHVHKGAYIFSEPGFGHFSYVFEFYTDRHYTSIIDPASYPVEVELQDMMYMEVQAQSSLSSIEVFVESCRATAHDDPNDSLYYDIIKDGCLEDDTVEIYPSRQTEFRFGMKAFTFIGNFQEVYMSCTVILCTSEDTNTRCAQGCTNGT
uniref:Soluble scavenger receptor cysteine-rich domain-containing protein SSC5D n=1 Tax=Latimeria chalumnae TaxID=7897 RepID=H3ATL0_LATCH